MKPKITKKLKAAEALLALHPDSIRLNERVKVLKGVLDMYPKRARFVKPDIEDIIDYFEEKKSPDPISNAHAFYDYYESINWYVGKKKMHKWRSSVSGWIRRNKNGNPAKKIGRVLDTTGELDKEYFEKILGKKL